jgi:hypothetical protein
MRPLKLTLILISISIFNGFGQNYQTVYSNRIANFENQYKNVKSIRIDSAKYQTDSILYPFTVIQQLDYNCFSPKVASWIGEKVIINENGENKFLNKMNDTITLNTKAKFGDKWIAFQLIDSFIIEATVIKHDTMSFLGINDSIKIIGFQAYDKSMNPLDCDINEMNIQISKNYGFVKTFNIYLFPNFQVDYPSEQFEEYNLIGLSKPRVGIQNLTWFEVNDFQVGDALHILDESSSWYGNGYGYATTDKAIYKYLERADYTDSIVYRFSRKQSIYTTWIDSSSYKFFYDTLKTTVKCDTLFDKLPGEPIITDYETYNYYMTNEVPISKTNPRGIESFLFSGGSCWYMLLADGCLTEDKYIKGLGGPYYSCTNAFSLGGAKRKLVYYKKGETTWGSPLIITGNTDIELTSKIKVFPNPAKNYLNIIFEKDINSDLTIDIFDINGRSIISLKLDSFDSKINISDLGPGIYIYKLVGNEKVFKMDKLIIE